MLYYMGVSGTQPPEHRHGLTFVSHAGEDKMFVKSLLKAIEDTKVAAFFDDDMVVGTSAENEMTSQAAEADQAILVLSRPFLTKAWPMKELNIFLKNNVKIYPLYYKVTPGDLWDIVKIFDRRAGEDRLAFCRKLEANPVDWRDLMDTISASTRGAKSTSLPRPLEWREDAEKLGSLKGLRCEDFDNNELSYAKAIATMVSPPRLPPTVSPLPDHFVKLAVVDDVISKFLDKPIGRNTRHVVVTGMGGTGKSLIASAVVRDKGLRRHFEHGVLWINDEASGYNERRFLLTLKVLASQFQELVLSRFYRQGRASHYEQVTFKTVQDAQKYFLMCQTRHSLKCLLVVDSAWNSQVLDAVDKMGFHILATTRKEDAMPAGDRWCQLPVPAIGEDDALLILKNCSEAPDSVPRDPALQVAKDCTFLRLALAIAGATPPVVDDPLSTDAWCQLHEKLTNKVEMQLAKGEERNTLNTILDASYEDLGNEHKAYFVMLAVLAHDTVASIEMLSHLWGREVRGDEYLVHDLLLDFAKDTIDGETKNAATSRQAQYLGRLDVLEAYQSNAREFSRGYYALIALWRSLEDLSGYKTLEVQTYERSLNVLKQSKASVELAGTFDAVASLFHMQGKYDRAEPLLGRLLAIKEQTPSPDHSAVAKSLKNLAEVLQAQGKRKEAIPQWERLLALLKEAPEQHQEEINSVTYELQRAEESQGGCD